MRDAAMFRAIEFATRAHSGQFRKGTRLPYILHPLRVAQILIEADCAEELVLAGVLHDTVEDTPATARQIEAAFGATVAELVLSVSEPDKSAPWQVRKQHTIDSLRVAGVPTLVLACADKLDNVRSMRRGERLAGPEFWQRFRRPRIDQAWYYGTVAATLAERATEPPLLGLVEALSREVERLFASPAARD